MQWLMQGRLRENAYFSCPSLRSVLRILPAFSTFFPESVGGILVT